MLWLHMAWLLLIHSVLALFFFFFQGQKKTISIQVTSGEKWWWFPCDLEQVISPPSAAVCSSTAFPALVFSNSMILWLLTSHRADLLLWQRERFPKFPLHSLLWVWCRWMELAMFIISDPLYRGCSSLYPTSWDRSTSRWQLKLFHPSRHSGFEKIIMLIFLSTTVLAQHLLSELSEYGPTQFFY